MLFLTTTICWISMLWIGAGAWAQETVRLDTDDIQRGTIKARSTAQDGFAPILRVESARVELTLPSGTPYAAHLTTVFDDRTGRFWWTFQGSGRSDPDDRIAHIHDRVALYVSDQEIVGAQLDTPPPSIWISRSTATAASVEKAREIALHSLGQMLAQIEDGTARFERQASLWNALPTDFIFDPNSTWLTMNASIIGIDRLRRGWQVTLESHDGQRAEVMLDELFNLVRAKVLGDPPD